MTDKLTFSVIWTLTPEGKVTTYTHDHFIQWVPVNHPLCAWDRAGVPGWEDEGAVGAAAVEKNRDKPPAFEELSVHLEGQTDPKQLEASYLFLIFDQVKEEISKQSQVGRLSAGDKMDMKANVPFQWQGEHLGYSLFEGGHPGKGLWVWVGGGIKLGAASNASHRWIPGVSIPLKCPEESDFYKD